MNTGNKRLDHTAALRKNAEEKAKKNEAAIHEALTLSPQDAKRALHELRVHQIELEIQNEELLRTQAELEAARARYFDLFDLAPAGYLTLSEKGLIVEANLTASTLLGLARGELENKPFSRFIQAGNQEIYYRFFRKLMDSAAPQGCELKLKTDSLTWVSLEATAAQAQGNIIEYHIILIDITRRKLAEEYRNLSSEILRTLNDTLSWPEAIKGVLAIIKRKTGFDAVGIRMKKGEDFPYFTQDGFPKDFLFKEDTLIVPNPAEGICRDKDGAVSLECTCGLVLAGKTDPTNPLFTQGGSAWTNNSLQLLSIPADQDPRLNRRNSCVHEGFLSMALIPIRANHEIVGLLQLNDRKKDRLDPDAIGFFEGICDSIGLALMRKSMEDDLASANKDLEAFGYSVAHDLRSPLHSIVNCRSIIADDEESVLSMDSRKALEYILKDTKRMTEVISDLLAFSKIPSQQINRSQVNLSDLARNFWTTLSSSNPNRVIDFIIEPHVVAQADAGLMQILLENLLRNAWKFSGKKEQARVEFGTIREKSAIVYFVRDNGAGFDMALVAKLFEPFARLHEDNAFRGSGIGLAIVKRIVDKHGGAVWAQAERDKGATFYFTLEIGSRRFIGRGEPILKKPCSALVLDEKPEVISRPDSPP
jgi:PAS domain S-box-containing protein